MRPRINAACINRFAGVWADEKYTVLGHSEIFYFKRCEAIDKTKRVAITKGREITLCLNKAPFIKFSTDGSYTYIYRPDLDRNTHPSLKDFFIKKGCVHPDYLSLITRVAA